MTGLSNSALLGLCTEQELEVRPWIEPEARESTSVDAGAPNQDNSLYYLAKTVLLKALDDTNWRPLEFTVVAKARQTELG